uniref:Gag-pol polyprotein n=1 Tax=Solanum tuberosum TaxID=4113 RepID=M1DB37_SOLTU
MTAQANMDVVVPVNLNVGTMSSKLRGFTRINPPKFHGSKVEEDPQEFIDEVYKVLMIIGVTPVEKMEFSTYQLKDVSQVWFNQWKEGRVVDAGPLDWEKFKVAFLDRSNSMMNVPKGDILFHLIFEKKEKFVVSKKSGVSCNGTTDSPKVGPQTCNDPENDRVKLESHM